MAFAEIAFGQIKALRQPATPRNYEVWYTYATGYNPSLNQTINETLAQNGTLTDADLEQVYTTYISATRFSDKIDNVGVAGDGRDQPGHGDDGRRGRLGQHLHRKPDQRQRQARQRQGPRGPARHRRKPGGDRQRDEAEQPRAGAAAQRLEGRDQPASGKSRGGPHREPDRSADRRSPTASTSTSGWRRRSRKRPSAASRCRW